MKSSRRSYQMSVRAQATEENRRRIAAAARDQFAAAPYEEVTLTMIATAAGVSHQTVLNQFGSKGGVLQAAMELIHQEVAQLRARARRGDISSIVQVLIQQYEASG